MSEDDGSLGFHSLEIGAAKTPAEWAENDSVPASPKSWHWVHVARLDEAGHRLPLFWISENCDSSGAVTLGQFEMGMTASQKRSQIAKITAALL
mgnify:CR=1 FL=1